MYKYITYMFLFLGFVLYSNSLFVSADDVDEKDSFKANIPTGYRQVNEVNFDEKEITSAVKFADLAYKAYYADTTNVTRVAAYNAELKELENNGYKITTFRGETGQTLVSNLFKKTSTIGLYAQKDEELTIAFRGTKSKTDLLTDAYVYEKFFDKARFKGQEKGGVHAGFNKVFESYRDELTKQVMNSVLGGVRKINITGHSMGGAMSNLTALHLSQTMKAFGYNDVEIKVVTFNAPRVGSANFAEKLNNSIGIKNIARMTKGDREGVSSLLPGSAGFKHAGTNIVVDGGSANKIKDHKMSGFKNRQAEEALKKHNSNPVKKDGVRTQVKNSVSTGLNKVKSFFGFGKKNPAKA